MGLFGSLLSAPFKIINAPLKAFDELIDEPGTFSKPLSALSKEIEKVDEKEDS